jgi:hypothetical protein
MASTDYLNAAFDSVMHDIQGLVRLLPDIPFIDEQSAAMQKIRSSEGRAMVLKLVKNAVAAGEKADADKVKV